LAENEPECRAHPAAGQRWRAWRKRAFFGPYRAVVADPLEV